GGADRPIVLALQDQSSLAGIGNLWATEALWAARVAPTTPVGRLSEAELERLLAWAQREMRAAVTGRRPVRSVHRRAGRPCRRCGTPIRAAGVGDDNRIAYWCPRCQVVPAPSP
ncbi:MAG: zinc finger domain-containing protein, partial [Gaiella sp.]